MPVGARLSRLGNMHVHPARVALWLRRRVEDKAALRGLAYPWWIAALSMGAQMFCVLVAIGQRGAWLPPEPIALAALLVVAPSLFHLISSTWLPWWMSAASVLLASGWLLLQPLDLVTPADMAAVLGAFLVAEVTATDGPRAGLLTVVATGAVLLGAWQLVGLPGAGFYLLEVLLGLVIGYLIRWQMRALAAERNATAGERERAALAERQRIAGEIHDLVAHSLSVTMLHVTGARRALVEDRDVDDAIDALQDAERIGRQAMSDIRRTVGVLRTTDTGVAPLPTATDVADLVAQFRDAGLDVALRHVGDLASLSATTGLGVYRITQESLANVAKHAPTSPVAVDLVVDSGGVRLDVRSQVPTGARRGRDGSGLSGMVARAEQLGGRVLAGPRGTDWVVSLVIPPAAPDALGTDVTGGVAGHVAGGAASDGPAAGECFVRRALP